MNRRLYRILVILSILFTSCAGNGIWINKNDFGKEWPLVVESCYVECLGNYAVVIEADGKTYAVNDAARKIGTYPDAREITLNDENYPGEQVKMKLSDIEFEGLKLCE